jgi:hypothetical protein
MIRLEDVVEKLLWKHNVTEEEVIEALAGKPRIFVKNLDGSLPFAVGKGDLVVIVLSFFSVRPRLPSNYG